MLVKLIVVSLDLLKHLLSLVSSLDVFLLQVLVLSMESLILLNLLNSLTFVSTLIVCEHCSFFVELVHHFSLESIDVKVLVLLHNS